VKREDRKNPSPFARDLLKASASKLKALKYPVFYAIIAQ
jgi:hypothetical protein